MASRQEIFDALRGAYGDLMSTGNVTKALGYRDITSAKRLLTNAGVPSYDLGGGKKQYSTIDIARFIDNCRRGK